MAFIAKRTNKAADAEISLRDSLFTGSAERLWDRTRDQGFVTVPKTMPFIAQMLDDMSEKGKPLGGVYQILWTYTWNNNGFVRLGNVNELAFVAGFRGERGERTLRDRLRALEKLGFIELKAHGGNPTGFAFIPNPHKVLLDLHARHQAATPAEQAKLPRLREETFTAFLVRAIDVKAVDVRRFQEELAAPAEESKEDKPEAAKLPRRRLVRPATKPAEAAKE